MEIFDGIEIIFSVQEFEIVGKVLKKNASIITQEDLTKILKS